ncbi:MAG: hypothetical protein ACRC1J_11320 [Sandaracinobacteroides sp.]
MKEFFEGTRLGALIAWLRLRIAEPSTWAGFAMIAVVLGSDPMQAQGVAQAISLIIGGGLVASGPVPARTAGE